jgi:hypothetical protein
MAISPNVDFTAGAVLTATQQNQFPRGIVSFAQSTSAGTANTTESVQITSSTFTAVANRYYRVTYYEPLVIIGGLTPSYLGFRVRLTSLTGTILATEEPESMPTPSDGQIINFQFVTTFTAGSTVLVATAYTGTNSASLYGAATVRRQLIVEDLGPA